MTQIAVLASTALGAAVRDRWFVVIGGAFCALTLGASALALVGTDVIGFSAFDRTAGTLIGLTLLFIPLLALTIGAGWLAARRESGALGLVLAQPVSRAQVFVGEYLGVAAALIGASATGFGLAAGVLSFRVGPERLAAYLALVALSMLLALAVLGLGFLVSARAPTHSRALGLGVVLWLALVVLSDLGILGLAVSAQLGARGVFWLTMANPVDVFRIAAILMVVHSPDLTGPVGMYATSRFGETGTVGLLLAALAGWIAVSFTAGLVLFCLRREP
ncbi:MAG TPA: ABC transporter permease subunit [bacterium]|nr:ABC transporter permease subunit [bacterium]